MYSLTTLVNQPTTHLATTGSEKRAASDPLSKTPQQRSHIGNNKQPRAHNKHITFLNTQTSKNNSTTTDSAVQQIEGIWSAKTQRTVTKKKAWRAAANFATLQSGSVDVLKVFLDCYRSLLHEQ